jgi:two-component system phosphate regulon sensor histidine kinase PhoR
MTEQLSSNNSTSGNTHIPLVHDDVVNYVNRIKEEQSRLLATIESLQLGFLIIDIKNNILIKNIALDSILQLKDMGSILLLGDIADVSDGLLKTGFDLRTSYERSISERSTLEFKEVTLGDKFLHVFIAPIISPLDDTVVTGATVIVEDVTESKVFEQGRDEFFSIASHELRTPLTAIRGNASMILEYYGDKIIDTDMKEMIGDMLTSSERLIRIVNDFLDVSRLEQRRMQFKLEDVDILPIIQETMNELGEVVRGRGLTLELAPLSGQSHAFADPFRVKQVLMNLVGNGINYTETGGVTVSVDREGEMLRVRVTDTGAGIRSDQSNLLFRKFQQIGEEIYSRKVMSTGLGLYISKLIVESMGGTIQLEKSEIGKGSTFCFTLPLIQKPDAGTVAPAT